MFSCGKKAQRLVLLQHPSVTRSYLPFGNFGYRTLCELTRSRKLQSELQKNRFEHARSSTAQLTSRYFFKSPQTFCSGMPRQPVGQVTLQIKHKEFYFRTGLTTSPNNFSVVAIGLPNPRARTIWAVRNVLLPFASARNRNLQPNNEPKNAYKEPKFLQFYPEFQHRAIACFWPGKKQFEYHATLREIHLQVTRVNSRWVRINQRQLQHLVGGKLRKTLGYGQTNKHQEHNDQGASRACVMLVLDFLYFGHDVNAQTKKALPESLPKAGPVVRWDQCGEMTSKLDARVGSPAITCSSLRFTPACYFASLCKNHVRNQANVATHRAA